MVRLSAEGGIVSMNSTTKKVVANLFADAKNRNNTAANTNWYIGYSVLLLPPAGVAA